MFHFCWWTDVLIKSLCVVRIVPNIFVRCAFWRWSIPFACEGSTLRPFASEGSASHGARKLLVLLLSFPQVIVYFSHGVQNTQRRNLLNRWAQDEQGAWTLAAVMDNCPLQGLVHFYHQKNKSPQKNQWLDRASMLHQRKSGAPMQQAHLRSYSLTS